MQKSEKYSVVEAKKIKRNFRLLAASSLVLVVGGSIFIKYIEDLEWLDAVYFSLISLTTVGYGDITPKTSAGKIFIMFFVLVGMGLIATLANTMLRNIAARKVIKEAETKEDQ